MFDIISGISQNINYGILIAPKQYVSTAGDFTAKALDMYKDLEDLEVRTEQDSVILYEEILTSFHTDLTVAICLILLQTLALPLIRFRQRS